MSPCLHCGQAIDRTLDPDKKFCNRRCYGDWKIAQAAGFKNLSPRQLQTFVLFLEGHQWKEIAARMGLSPKTVATYKTDLCQKLGVANDVELVKAGILHGLTSVELDKSAAARTV